jgi:hypothetical protein
VEADWGKDTVHEQRSASRYQVLNHLDCIVEDRGVCEFDISPETIQHTTIRACFIRTVC